MIEPADDTVEREPDRPAYEMLQVTNLNDFPINDMFDGVPISFPTGVAVEVGFAIAAHCFGYPGEPDDMAVHMARRYGWATREQLVWNKDRKPLFFEKAMNVKIVPILFDLVRRPLNAPMPADDGAPDDRPRPVMEADTTTKVGKRKRQPRRYEAAAKAARKADRHAVGPRGERSRSRAR